MQVVKKKILKPSQSEIYGISLNDFQTRHKTREKHIIYCYKVPMIREVAANSKENLHDRGHQLTDLSTNIFQ